MVQFSIPIGVLLVVFLGIAIRKIGRFKLHIWQIVGLGALFVILTGQISVVQSFKSIDFTILLYLFGVFVIGRALDISGYLDKLAYYFFRYAKNGKHILAIVVFCFGLSSALLMNDTLAIIGTQFILLITKRNRELITPLLLGLAFAITVGSILSPIGNPQNLLIASLSGMHNPLTTFLYHLTLPTLISLVIVYFLVNWKYKRCLQTPMIIQPPKFIADIRLARLAKISLILMLVLILIKLIAGYLPWNALSKIGFVDIVLLAALPILLFSGKRWQIVKSVDWATLIFFVALFILMAAVWQTGFFQSLISQWHIKISHIAVIVCISVILSQFISNVPLVILYLPLLQHLHVGTLPLLALVVGSTIAGSLFYTGAASNVIIIQQAEKHKHHAFSFLEFAYLGVPITVLCIMVYWVFLR